MLCCAGVEAQDRPPTIGPVVLDLRGTFPNFPGDTQLAASRGLSTAELPGRGLGVEIGAHVYLFSWRAVTVGIGGQLTLARAHWSEPAVPEGTSPRGVTEHFVSVAPQLSLNFGSGDGWSYLSGGIGRSVWSIVPDGADRILSDEERLPTINYGGGARWLTTRHVAFTFDVRFHAIDPGGAHAGHPGSPRTTLLIMGAGVSLK